ncbi:hypothetical protein Egran_03801 [Elaphomyces granulatus]|uniref:Uncharacterized protein n=1 Tax=Elaphomyces granulatus TaxID=519963 RepID=A0A232LWE9_9EURO|nr:hypothetical protein Egran_03801 [Elaphomyces granulatus]
MPYKQQHYVVTIRWCAYYSIEGRTSMLKEEFMAVPYKQHRLVGEYGNSLQAASQGDREKVVRILLDRGAVLKEDIMAMPYKQHHERVPRTCHEGTGQPCHFA